MVEAAIRDYHIIIDTEARSISHDCADWGKTLATKKLCKHVAKLLLSMNRTRATEILREMYSEQAKWQFLLYASQ
jgi:hypothetical protein